MAIKLDWKRLDGQYMGGKWYVNYQAEVCQSFALLCMGETDGGTFAVRVEILGLTAYHSRREWPLEEAKKQAVAAGIREARRQQKLMSDIESALRNTETE